MHKALCIFLGLAALPLLAAEPPAVRFTQNKGQWPAQVAYRALVPGGALFVERNAFTYSLHTGGPLAEHGHAHAGPPDPERAHAFRVSFAGAGQAMPEGLGKQPGYENFFLGNDPAAWGTGCAVYGGVKLKGLYPGIDLEMDGQGGLKYDFVVAPGADPAQVVLQFQGQSDLRLEQGRLRVGTTAGTVWEEAPVAYQAGPGGRKTVPCHFVLEGNRVHFALPEGYDPALPLVIDPVLTFGSYSGSTADNFGFTASYDAQGHLYGGGIVFGSGYPTTVGVLDATFNQGTIDIGITKFTPDGSGLVWSTYIGGSGNESPHSLVVNSADELYLLASTGSADFPATAGAFDATFHGGPPINSMTGGWAGLTSGYGYGHAAGTDIAVAHFSADATALIACTYVGGSGNDGLNNVLPLSHNYGDHFRGEIALDPQEWPVVSSSTQSTDMPVSANAPQATFGGGAQDAFLFRLNPALSTLQSTYFGGTGNDSGYGVQFDSNGQVFTTGGTTSTNLPMAGTPWHGTFSGTADGYVVRWNAGLTQQLSSSFLGTSAFDQSYFVQVDLSDQVYVVGQTHGAYPVSTGVYSNPGSSQFIQKLSNDLSTNEWSTVIGNGLGNEDISPSAFLVSDCGQIYFSGWGGNVNHYAQAGASTTNGLTVTPDAFQSTTDGSDFYLMLLNPDAVSLSYATFFGGSSMEHVDGGTSRFDKNGTVYQAVCAGCGGSDNFPTTPGAWSTTNGAFNCNLGVFKFELAVSVPSISIDGPLEFCAPDTIQFINSSTGGNMYLWDFGDGATSTEFAPAHTYTDTGSFTVSMVLSDSYGCTATASTEITIAGIAPPVAIVSPVPPLCPGESVQLHASGGDTYQWIPATGVSDPTSPDPVASPAGPATYTVVVSGECGQDSASVALTILDPAGSAGADTATCLGDAVMLAATGGGTYAWAADGSLSATDTATPTAAPTAPTLYTVAITTPDGCVVLDSVFVNVFLHPPVPALQDTLICPGTSATLTTGTAAWYQWQGSPGIGSSGTQTTVVSPAAPTVYTVVLHNACGSVADSAFVDIDAVHALAWPDTLVCPGQRVVLHASGGTTYEWAPAASASDSLVLDPVQAGTYTVTVTDTVGCSATAQATVALHPPALVNAGADVAIDWGSSAVLTASGTGTILWSPGSSLTCTSCVQTVATPDSTSTYTVEITDANGCKATDQVTVFFRGSLFVPNTFTPNSDDVNDVFKALAHDVSDYRLMVFNRWGQLIFSTEQLADGWDGTFGGQESPIDTYVWRIDYTERHGPAHTVYGHVNLIR